MTDQKPTETQTPPPPASGGTDWFGPTIENAKAVYALYLLSFLLSGIPALVGLVFAYMNRGKADAVTASHYTFQIRTFWIGFLASLVAGLLMLIAIGFPIMIAIAIWVIVRCVKGLQWSMSGQPVPNPQSWMI